jgi:acyl-CoA synthetase (AMP-forming)/AMP-acid ligase II
MKRRQRSTREEKKPLSLQALWRATVEGDPSAVALVDDAAGTTYTRLDLAKAGDAWALEHGAAVRGARVLFAEPNGQEWMRVFLGLVASDAVAVALDPGEPHLAQRALARELGVEFIWHAGKLERVEAETKPVGTNVRLLKVTSGSTGVPRALPFGDAHMEADARQICRTMGIKPEDRNLGIIPFGHSYGLGNLVMPLLIQGTSIVCGVPALPHALGGAIARWEPTVFPAVPALLRILTESDVEAAHLRSLRTVISAGAPLLPEIARAFRKKFGLLVHNFYGSSETGGIAYDRTGQAALTGRSVGQPLHGVDIAFTDGGRFWVKSAAVGGRGRFKPADRAVLTDKGELFLLGRTGRMLKIGGRRIDPAEVEIALRSVPGVTDAFVDAHPERPDALAAVVATRVEAGLIREALRPRLAPWKVPRKIVTVETFPVSARGKVDVRRLRDVLRGVE